MFMDTMRYPKTEWWEQIKRRRRAELGIESPYTYHIQRELIEADCLFYSGIWYAPDEFVQSQFMATIQIMADQEATIHHMIGIWSRALFGTDRHHRTTNDIRTATEILDEYGKTKSLIIMKHLGIATKEKWAQCCQLMTSWRKFGKEAVAATEQQIATHLAAENARHEAEKQADRREAHENARKLWELMPDTAKGLIKKAVLDEDTRLQQWMMEGNPGASSLLEKKCIAKMIKE